MFSSYSIYFADTFTVSVAWWSNPLLDFPIIWSILVVNHFKNLGNVGKNDFTGFILSTTYYETNYRILATEISTSTMIKTAHWLEWMEKLKKMIISKT